MLTGESAPVVKETSASEPDATIGDRACMGFAGTLLFTGQATALVVETGNRAEIGKIAGLLRSVQQVTTPLLIQMEHFGRTVRARVGMVLESRYVRVPCRSLSNLCRLRQYASLSHLRRFSLLGKADT